MKLRKAAAIVVAFTGAAFALGPAHGQQTEKFKSLDRDTDGFLSKGETSPIRDYDRAFSEADDNRDGRLSSDEFIKSESIHERQRLGKYIGDTALTAKVKTALLRERGLKSMDVSVESNEGRVLLSGFVESDTQRETAMRVARSIDGVKEVKDGMSVK